MFRALRLKPGLVLRAYQFREGGNGNGFVYALPEDSEFPQPEDCPRVESHFLEPPRPPAALEDVIKAIDGDGTPWCYLSASLLKRELDEFGAMWHGANWSTRTLLGSAPWQLPKSGFMAEPLSGSDQWSWKEAQPAEWAPTVSQKGARVTVIFYTYTALEQKVTVRHVDTYRAGSYRAENKEVVIAKGQGGYVF